jgi:transcriptional regulator with XRE-family HTH domain
MDDLGIGRLFRELRLRLQWTQQQVADRAGISRAAYSEMEHGRLGKAPLDKVRNVGAVLEVRLRLEPSWRGAAADIVTSSRHARMAEVVTRILIEAGWEVRPEVSFNWYGERGVVDLVAWHAPTRTVLLIELKTELADVNDLLAVTDRRRRLAARIVEPFGWQPQFVAQWVAIAASRTNERRVRAHRALLRAAFPADGRAVAGFLARPGRALAALSFLPDVSGSSARHGSAPRLRVRRARLNVGKPPKAA